MACGGGGARGKAVYTGLLLPGDRIIGLDTPSGGNTSHEYYTPHGTKVSSASIFFESFPYKVNPQTGYIDYEKLEERALDFRPKILICGGSSYSREWDYGRFRQIADKCGAVLLCDMAQISGLIAAKVCKLFGIHGAEFANFPESVVALAREKAAKLEDFSPTSIISTDAGQEADRRWRQRPRAIHPLGKHTPPITDRSILEEEMYFLQDLSAMEAKPLNQMLAGFFSG
ncbi:hypothetical protein GOBAR_DD13381 [Gossypium barbadense]|nr:hypothetical protein GOBAR_DD13381 [Gossypium barbadense]